MDAEEREAHLADPTLDAGVVGQVRGLLSLDSRLGEDGPSSDWRAGHPWPGDHVGAYRLLAPLGMGGMGTVWRAESRTYESITVAIKFPSGEGADQEEASARLRREQSVLSGITHPGVIAIVDASETDGGVPFLVLPECHGSDLAEYCEKTHPEARALAGLLLLIARALGAVHRAGVVHRDLKPQNVLVSDDGWPTIIDFGIAQVSEEAASVHSHMTVGTALMTPSFASPEQRSGGRLSAATDVFAFGKLIEECLRRGRVQPGRATARLRTLARRATSESPDNRPADGGALAVELEQVVHGRTPRWLIVVAVTSACLALAFGIRFGLGVSPDQLPRGESAGGPAREEQDHRASLDGAGPGPGAGLDPSPRLAEAWEADESGDHQRADEVTLELAANWYELAVTERVEFVRLLSKAGRHANTLEVAQSIEPGSVSVMQASLLADLTLAAEQALGERVALESWRALGAQANEGEGGRWGEIASQIESRRLSVADPEVIQSLASNADFWGAGYRDMPDADLVTIGLMRARLVVWELAPTSDLAGLSDLEREIARRAAGGAGMRMASAAVAVRAARIIEIARTDPQSALAVSQSPLPFDGAWYLPVDARLIIHLGMAYCASRCGEVEVARSALHEAEAVITEVGGVDWFVAQMAQSQASAPAIQPGELLEALGIAVAGSMPDEVGSQRLPAGIWWLGTELR
ncbi:MAG: serine/threonine-protein kinase [Planctomycetota bacterium]